MADPVFTDDEHFAFALHHKVDALNDLLRQAAKRGLHVMGEFAHSDGVQLLYLDVYRRVEQRQIAAPPPHDKVVFQKGMRLKHKLLAGAPEFVVQTITRRGDETLVWVVPAEAGRPATGYPLRAMQQSFEIIEQGVVDRHAQ